MNIIELVSLNKIFMALKLIVEFGERKGLVEDARACTAFVFVFIYRKGLVKQIRFYE